MVTLIEVEVFKKNIYQYDFNTLIGNFPQLKIAAISVGGDKKSISKACLDEIKTCAGYSWSYSLAESFGPEEDKRKKKFFSFISMESLFEVTYLLLRPLKYIDHP